MLCAACGNEVKGGIGMGGVLLCRGCAEDIRIEMDRLRADGKSVNVHGIARRMYRTAHPMANDYLLRDVPQELMDAAKHRAIDEHITLRELIIRALAEYVNVHPA